MKEKFTRLDSAYRSRRAFTCLKKLAMVLLLLTFSWNGWAQTLVRGTVKDKRGTPLPGVTITTVTGDKGTTTDAQGAFSLELAPTAVLKASYIGYETQEIPLNGRSSLSIVLIQASSGLNEVVVVGYGEQKKVNLTGAVDQIGSAYLENKPVPNMSRALEGAIPNLNINFSDGRPTSNPSWNIRGLTSIGAGGEALVLIDGVVGDPSLLNPDDVQSITVLKDAASAAIYGSRGAFGVVLITTKSPQKGKPLLTYSGSYSMNQRTVTPDLVTDGYTWAKMFNDSYSSWYDYNATPSSIGASGLPFSGTYLDSLKYRSEHPGQLPDVTIDPVTGNYVYYGNTNWYKELYAKNMPAIDQSLSVSGGDEKVDYRISGRYFRQEGIYQIRSDPYNKYNLRVEGGVQVEPWLRIKGVMDFSSYKYSDPFNGSNIWGTLNVSGNGTPLAMMFNPDGTLTRTAAQGVGLLYTQAESTTKQSQIETHLSFVADLIKDKWTLNGDFAYQNSLLNLNSKTVPLNYSVKPDQVLQVGNSLLGETFYKGYYYAYNLYSGFTQDFGNSHFKFLLGANMEINQSFKVGVSRDNLLIPQLSDLNLAVGDNTTAVGGGSEWATVGMFSRINYNYKGKYLLEVNGRYDGSSKFPESKQFGLFPSVSAGWRVSEENFMDWSRGWLDNLKVRGSYGSLGNSQINPYVFLEQLRASKSPVIINGKQPAYISSPAALADRFTWETATTLDFGADMDLWNSRLSGSFDWYSRKTTNMITPGPVLPAVFGAAVPSGNYANLETKGFELSLKWNGEIHTSSAIRYSVRVTLANNVAHITKYNNPQGILTPDPYLFTMNYYQGEKVGDIWGYVTEGLFTSTDDIKNHADQSAVQVSSGNKVMPGDVKFKDLNGDGKINKGERTVSNHGDWKIIGNQSPQYMYGITGDVSWKGFSVSAFFQGVGKRDWYPSYGSMDFWGQYTVWYGIIPKSNLKNNWSLNGNKADSYWPRYRGPMPYGDRELQPQTKYLQNVAYIRLKSLSINYSLPKQITDKIHFNQVQLYLIGQNIWTYSPMFKITKDIDPEVIEPGPSYDGNTYPMMKSFTFGIKLTL